MSANFAERIKTLANKASQVVSVLETEEATKNALVMPFLAALGYDVFDPNEVVPEFTADVATKKGEKVDYAIRRGEEIVILIEVKKSSEPLNESHAGQLFRYFSVTKARIAILTNGVQYRFYSDIDAPNKMDEKPFLEIDLANLRENMLVELSKLTKESFDLDDMLSAASNLKYMREIRRVFEEQLEEPSEEFVRFFFTHANPSARFVQSVKQQFTDLVKKTLSQVITDRVGARLRSALAQQDDAQHVARPRGEVVEELREPDEDGIVTTEEELEGYQIVRAVLSKLGCLDRVSYRDTKSYFGILFDDNNRKPICRLHFNRKQKYVGVFDEERRETRHAISDLAGLYQFEDQLRETASRYMKDSGVHAVVPLAPVRALETESG